MVQGLGFRVCTCVVFRGTLNPKPKTLNPGFRRSWDSHIEVSGV